MLEEMVFPIVILGLLNLMTITQFRNGDVTLQPFEDNLQLLFVGLFMIFHTSSFQLPNELNSTLFGP